MHASPEASAASDPLERLLTERRIVICVGTGGVGKTTISACLALRAAALGQRALVLTIDPAKRLADALGLESLSGEPTELPAEIHAQLGIDRERGCVSAMMLDMKRTFDDLVTRFAESEAAKARILDNQIYQHVSDALAGSGEYAAMEKVFELAETGRFDLIVLDTPPSQHALDFLDAPERLLQFLDSRLVQLLLHPAMSAGRFGMRLFQGAAHRALSMIERVSGIAFLEEISEFLLAFEGMSEGFRERARRVHGLLLGPSSSFVLVAGPSTTSAEDGLVFLDRLERANAPMAGILVNRMRLWPDSAGDPARLARADEAALGGDVEALADALERASGGVYDTARCRRAAHAAAEAARQYASIAALDAEGCRRLEERAGRGHLFVRRIAELSGDVHDTRALQEVGRMLFGDGTVVGPSGPQMTP